jgi:hypothetical protein
MPIDARLGGQVLAKTAKLSVGPLKSRASVNTVLCQSDRSLGVVQLPSTAPPGRAAQGRYRAVPLRRCRPRRPVSGPAIPDRRRGSQEACPRLPATVADGYVGPSDAGSTALRRPVAEVVVSAMGASAPSHDDAQCCSCRRPCSISLMTTNRIRRCGRQCCLLFS